MSPRFVVLTAVLVIGLALPAAVGAKQPTVRFATFNASLNRNAAGQLVSDLSTPNNAQAKTMAEIIQRFRPDVLLINEFDFVEDGVAAELFQDNYLSIGQNGAAPIDLRLLLRRAIQHGHPVRPRPE